MWKFIFCHNFVKKFTGASIARKIVQEWIERKKKSRIETGKQAGQKPLYMLHFHLFEVSVYAHNHRSLAAMHFEVTLHALDLRAHTYTHLTIVNPFSRD